MTTPVTFTRPPCSTVMAALAQGVRAGFPAVLGGDWASWSVTALIVEYGTGRMVLTVQHDCGIEATYRVTVDYS